METTVGFDGVRTQARQASLR